MGQLKNLILMAFLLQAYSLAANAEQDVLSFSNGELRERYLVLIKELRCPKCQNQNLADSNSMISEDLRKEVHRLLEEGKSDAEIIDFMVARYGDFVHYRPPVKSSTLLLWLLPGVFLLAVVSVPIVLLRRQRTAAISDVSLANRDQDRLERMLNQSPGSEK